MTENTEQRFDPRAHMMNVKGGKYLPVSARLIWFRQDHPDAILETDPHIVNETIAVFRTRIALPTGGIAVGWGSCTPNQFPDGYIEKAETKARGRALGALGYGTPEDEEDENALADGPVGGGRQYQGGGGNWSNGPARGNGGGGSSEQLATAPQKSRIQRLAAEMQMPPNELHAMIQQHTGTDFDYMNKRQASGVIDLLEARRPQAAGSPQESANSGAPVESRGNGNASPERGWSNGGGAQGNRGNVGGAPSGDEMSRPQFGKIAGIARDRGIPENDLASWVHEMSGLNWPNLTKREATQLIDQLLGGETAPF